MIFTAKSIKGLQKARTKDLIKTTIISCNILELENRSEQNTESYVQQNPLQDSPELFVYIRRQQPTLQIFTVNPVLQNITISSKDLGLTKRKINQIVTNSTTVQINTTKTDRELKQSKTKVHKTSRLQSTYVKF